MAIRDDAFAGKPINVPIIDAHTHLTGYWYGGWYQREYSVASVIAMMDGMGVDCIVTAPHGMVFGDIDDANAVAAEAAEAYPDRIYGYMSVRPQQGLDGVRKTIRRYASNPRFIGFKLLPGYHGPLACPEYDYALDFAIEVGCPVLSHVWAYAPPFDQIARAVQQRPTLKLIMAHQGGGTIDTSEAYAALMRDYPNLYMELCGSLFNTLTVEDLIALTGEDRLIYGTDMINLDPRFDFGRVVFSTLSDEVKGKVLAGNYLRLLHGSEMGQIALIEKRCVVEM